jgi:hypothetical protein
MIKRCSPLAFAMGALLTTVGYAGTAHADEVVVAHTDRSDHGTVTGPNAFMLHSGIWALGLSYAPALVVAISSSESYDKRLYAPVAGPWLDLAARDCSKDCSHETLNKALLVTDGIFQGIGALEILGSFLFVDRHTTTVAERERKIAKAPTFHLSPARLGTGAYGLTAAGTF